MPKNWCDWTDLMKGNVGEPEHALSKALRNSGPTLKKSEVPRKPTDEEIRKAILEGAQQQPTDEQLFGHLVPSEEQVKAAEDQWNNCFKKFFHTNHKPVESQDLSKSWGSRGPIWKEKLTEEEERIRKIQVDPSLIESD